MPSRNLDISRPQTHPYGPILSDRGLEIPAPMTVIAFEPPRNVASGSRHFATSTHHSIPFSPACGSIDTLLDMAPMGWGSRGECRLGVSKSRYFGNCKAIYRYRFRRVDDGVGVRSNVASRSRDIDISRFRVFGRLAMVP